MERPVSVLDMMPRAAQIYFGRLFVEKFLDVSRYRCDGSAIDPELAEFVSDIATLAGIEWQSRKINEMFEKLRKERFCD